MRIGASGSTSRGSRRRFLPSIDLQVDEYRCTRCWENAEKPSLAVEVFGDRAGSRSLNMLKVMQEICWPVLVV